MAVNKRDIDTLHGRLTALEALMVMVLSYRGPDALRLAIEDLDNRAKVTPGEAKELNALKTRLERALASLEQETTQIAARPS